MSFLMMNQMTRSRKFNRATNLVSNYGSSSVARKN
jgi:hypothetical protein